MNEGSDPLKQLFDAQIAAKSRRRRELAARPIEEKVRILVRLQGVASAIAQATRGHSRKPWNLG